MHQREELCKIKADYESKAGSPWSALFCTFGTLDDDDNANPVPGPPPEDDDDDDDDAAPDGLSVGCVRVAGDV